jgi:hypothetical protein
MYRLWSNTSCLKCLTYSRSSRSSSGLPGCRGWIFCHEGISGNATCHTRAASSAETSRQHRCPPASFPRTPGQDKLASDEAAGRMTMRRREFIAGLGSAAAWPLRVQQADRVRHVGALMNGVPGDSSLPARLLSEQMTSAAASVCESNRARGSLRKVAALLGIPLATLNDAFNRNPERFVRKEPRPPAKPMAWTNPPCGSLSRPAQK